MLIIQCCLNSTRFLFLCNGYHVFPYTYGYYQNWNIFPYNFIRHDIKCYLNHVEKVKDYRCNSYDPLVHGTRRPSGPSPLRLWKKKEKQSVLKFHRVNLWKATIVSCPKGVCPFSAPNAHANTLAPAVTESRIARYEAWCNVTHYS